MKLLIIYLIASSVLSLLGIIFFIVRDIILDKD